MSNYHRQIIDSRAAAEKRIAYCRREMECCRDGSPNRALWAERLAAAEAALDTI